jgi:hypothetical protein
MSPALIKLVSRAATRPWLRLSLTDSCAMSTVSRDLDLEPPARASFVMS